MKNYNTILTEKHPKYRLCHQTNLTNMNILQAKKYYDLIKNRWYNKLFTYSPLGKVFERQIKIIEDLGEKQIKAIQNQGQV